MSKPTCTVTGCTKPSRTRGLCNAHYLRLLRKGATDGNTRHATPEAAFKARTKPEGDCLIWTGGKGHHGHGMLWYDGQMRYAHRYAWERANGPIPDGMQVDHICHNRACVNLEHLRLASPEQNQSNRAGATVTNRRSGVRNVYPSGNRWSVQIAKDGKLRYFGTYPTIEEAADAAKTARRTLFGEFSGKG